MTDLGWWVLHGDTVMEALNRAYAGEHPGLLYMELYANTEEER